MRRNLRRPVFVVIPMYTTTNYPVDPRIALLVRHDFRRSVARRLRRVR
jgi:hypothetical protein